MNNSDWYCEEVEFRYFRDFDLYEIGCHTCGYKEKVTDRRWPKESYIKFCLEKGCTCKKESE